MTNNNKASTIAIMAIFFVSMGVGIVTPAIQNIAEAFSDVPFSTLLLVSTLPTLFMIPATILAGALAGSKVKYRTLAIIGIIIYILGGTAPYFQNDFTSILVSRAFFGIGIGLIFPLGSALILKLYDGQERANMLGLSNMISNIGGIVLQMLGAVLCSMSWQNTFLAHLLPIITLLIVIFMLPEPEKDAPLADGEKTKIPFGVYSTSILTGFCMMLAFPMLLNMSTIIISNGFGNAASAGIVLSMFTGGGMVGGGFFGKTFKISGRFSMAIGIIMLGIGLGVVYYAGSLVHLTIGSFAVGLGLFTIVPAAMMDLGKVVSPAAFAMAAGILMAFLNVGGFISTYYMLFLSNTFGSTDIRFPLFFGMIAAFITAAVLIITKLKPEPAAPETAS